MPAKTEAEQKLKNKQIYAEGSNLEAHIIADMLRIESITAELREFKEDTKARLNKIEGWVIAIVGTTVTTLIATVASLVIKLLG